ncbi:MAG: hypothetical protein IPO35_08275 [Uliginosibacterium sp.]|jgi:type IV pilus assembly protein PilX|nr:hypothetical protein [Uliginosibacterium sp.]
MKPNSALLSRAKTRQSGAALVVGLVVLVMLTLLGIAAMRTSALEERMAGNLRDSNIAFQSAEAALREAMASKLHVEPYDGTKPGYSGQIKTFLDTSYKPVSEFSYWSEYAWGSKSIAATQMSGISEQPHYVVENMEVQDGPKLTGVPVKRVYRITAMSRGATDRSEVIVQGAIIRED